MQIAVANTSPLLLLALLACPVGMGLMMFFMGRGMMGGHKEDGDRAEGRDAGSLANLKAEQARLAEKIDELEGAPEPDNVGERAESPS